MNLPVDFVMRTQALLEGEWEDLASVLNSDVPVSIRLNSRKLNNGINHSLKNVPWCDTGFYLDERPQFTFDPLLHAGCYYVQEASSMFVARAVKQYVDGDVKVLDLCAAPGGKSTLLSDILSEGSLLVSNEVIRSRANILAENMAKWGNPNVVVTNNDPFGIGRLFEFFDIILVDAPCSGEGMFRKDEGAISEWSVDNVMLCMNRQREILADIWPALKPGGLLLYSTCTYNIEENERNIQWLHDELYAEAIPVDIKEEWEITPSFVKDLPAYRFFPHKVKGEGLFFAAVRKPEYESVTKRKYNKTKTAKIDLPSEYKNYILNKEHFAFYQKKDTWFAFPSDLYDDLLYLRSSLNIVSEGICLGEFKGKDFIPAQALALSSKLNAEAFEVCDVDWKTAISYLRKEALILPDMPKGYILLTYKDMPLGFVKNIGNRANNLYPQEWRIRSANIPDGEVKVVG